LHKIRVILRAAGPVEKGCMENPLDAITLSHILLLLELI
jgi:hypothetical protein